MFNSLSEGTLEFLPIPFGRERVEGWFQNIDYAKTLPILGLIESDGGEKVIASASLSFMQLEVFSHRAEFGITVHDDYQNMGLGTIMTRYMLDIARDHGLKKVDLRVVAHNGRAIHVYEKLGFRKEGLHRMDHWNRVLGRYCDIYYMGIIL
jgi:putative acetyltransferase